MVPDLGRLCSLLHLFKLTRDFHPRMRMYVWSGVPETDGDLEAGIVIHEYMHGM